MSNTPHLDPAAILGHVTFPSQWTVIGPFAGNTGTPPPAALQAVPDTLTIDGTRRAAAQLTPVRQQAQFGKWFGKPPYSEQQSVFIFLPFHSDTAQKVTLGLGADWYFEAWLGGDQIIDQMDDGNVVAPPAIHNHMRDVQVQPGDHLLVVRLVNGKGEPMLAAGGPDELRAGDFATILPPPDHELDAQALLERYPPDPQASISWEMPEGFDPRVPGLGMRQLKEAEHLDLMRCLPSTSPADEGGSGRYESVVHGTWNHNLSSFVYKDRLIGIWHNHAQDENGPGSRTLARVGKVINERGDIDWGGEENLIELAPAAVPVRRRLLQADEDAVRDAQASGYFRLVDDRLIFCGKLTALHGVTTRVPRGIPWEEVLAPEDFAFGKSAQTPADKFAVWDLDFRFYQEWGIKDDRFQPLSPLYKEKELADKLPMTTELSLPLEPLLPPYGDAPLLDEAPDTFQALVSQAMAQGADGLRYRPGTEHLTEDGTNGLCHGEEYRRPDGTWVAVRENQRPRVHPFFYAAEKRDAEAFYPPARRSNLYGAVKPAPGTLPDGRVYLVINSPNRQNMFLTVSADGRHFDQTWFLRYERLSDFTPGAMKNEGSAGAGPQYFKSAVLGQSLWLIYSISKEHIGATRVPIAALT